MTLAQLLLLLTPAAPATPDGQPVATDWNPTITLLKASRDLLDIKPYRDQFEVATHDVNSKSLRPARKVTTDEGDAFVDPNRVALALQELIVGRAVSFLFGLSPTLSKNGKLTEQEQQVFDALGKVLRKVKSDSHNMALATDLFRCTQAAECWYPVESPGYTAYGFSSKYKLRVAVFSPWRGDSLYPLFDDEGDMIAFSRAYVRKNDEQKDVSYFETYTAERTLVWENQNVSQSGWVLIDDKPNPIGKIPVVYARQDKVEWASVQNLIDRLETLLSNYADNNDYNASPTLVVKGTITGWAKKGQQGKVVEVDQDASVDYVSWDQSTDAVKLEIDTKLRMINTITQTPDISFEAMKGLGDLSGAAMDRLFMDAHLKVKAKQGLIFDAFLERRLSIVQAFIGEFNTTLKTAAATLSAELTIRPYTINDETDQITLLTTATGGRPLLSQQTAVGLTGLVEDSEEEMSRIGAEQATAAQQSVFPVGGM